MSLPFSRRQVNDSRRHKIIFSVVFLGGVFEKMGVFCGNWVDKTWFAAGKNVVN
jgi:hypothetical protein